MGQAKSSSSSEEDDGDNDGSGSEDDKSASSPDAITVEGIDMLVIIVFKNSQYHKRHRHFTVLLRLL